jgi:putative endonuclease
VNRRGDLGRYGEDTATRFLETLGYVIIGRNVRVPGGEIDLICKDGNVIVFVEVKTRTGSRFGSGISAVDARKRRTLRALAADWLQIVAPRAQARFDIVTVREGRPALHRGAFS